MQNRISDWQLRNEESRELHGVEHCLYELAMLDNSIERDRRAVIFAGTEAPLSAYDITETAHRRRNIMLECGLDYYRVEHRIKLAAAFDITIEQAGFLQADGAVMWFLEVAPVLLRRGLIDHDIFLTLSEYITGMHVTPHDAAVVSAALVSKTGLFNHLPMPSNDNLLCSPDVSNEAKKIKL